MVRYGAFWPVLALFGPVLGLFGSFWRSFARFGSLCSFFSRFFSQYFIIAEMSLELELQQTDDQCLKLDAKLVLVLRFNKPIKYTSMEEIFQTLV